MTRDDILVYLKANLKRKRVEHSLGVEETARKLARRYGCDEEKAALAGLAHDCAKNLSGDAMLAYAEEEGFPTDGLSAADTSILHAPAGAAVARRELGIWDVEVLSAIRWHTVPKPGMTVLDKVVSLADTIEPNRAFDGVERIRGAAKRSLDEAFRLSLALTMRYVLEEGVYLHPMTLQVYNELTAGLAAEREKIT